MLYRDHKADHASVRAFSSPRLAAWDGQGSLSRTHPSQVPRMNKLGNRTTQKKRRNAPNACRTYPQNMVRTPLLSRLEGQIHRTAFQVWKSWITCGRGAWKKRNVPSWTPMFHLNGSGHQNAALVVRVCLHQHSLCFRQYMAVAEKKRYQNGLRW